MATTPKLGESAVLAKMREANNRRARLSAERFELARKQYESERQEYELMDLWLDLSSEQ